MFLDHLNVSYFLFRFSQFSCCVPKQAYNLDLLEEHLEKRYSAGGYSVWFNSDDDIHPKHSELIISSLTRSQDSSIKSQPRSVALSCNVCVCV